jgi:hypothetical protein
MSGLITAALRWITRFVKNACRTNTCNAVVNQLTKAFEFKIAELGVQESALGAHSHVGR